MSTLRANTITDAAGTGVPAFPNGAQTIRLGTSVASTSGTAIDFTGIPAGVRRVTVMFNGVSTSGTSNILVQIGDSGGFVSTGYTSGAMSGLTTVAGATSTAGFLVTSVLGSAANNLSGHTCLTNFSGNTWVASGTANENVGRFTVASGNVALSGALERLRITTVNGTDTFDAGSLNISWEF